MLFLSLTITLCSRNYLVYFVGKIIEAQAVFKLTCSRSYTYRVSQDLSTNLGDTKTRTSSHGAIAAFV